MAFDLEKILTISAGDYCQIQGKSLADYEAKGFHFLVKDIKDGTKLGELLKAYVPKEAEVIVEFRPYFTEYGVSFSRGPVSIFGASGTALIPKKK